MPSCVIDEKEAIEFVVNKRKPEEDDTNAEAVTSTVDRESHRPPIMNL